MYGIYLEIQRTGGMLSQGVNVHCVHSVSVSHVIREVYFSMVLEQE